MPKSTGKTTALTLTRICFTSYCSFKFHCMCLYLTCHVLYSSSLWAYLHSQILHCKPLNLHLVGCWEKCVPFCYDTTCQRGSYNKAGTEELQQSRTPQDAWHSGQHPAQHLWELQPDIVTRKLHVTKAHSHFFLSQCSQRQKQQGYSRG